MTAVFYAAGAVLVAVGLTTGAMLMYSLGKRRAASQYDAEPGDYSKLFATHRQLDNDFGRVTRHRNALVMELADAHAVIDAQAEELAETDRALAALRTSVEQHRAVRTLAGRPAVLTPEQRELAADDAAWRRSQDGAGDR